MTRSHRKYSRGGRDTKYKRNKRRKQRKLVKESGDSIQLPPRIISIHSDWRSPSDCGISFTKDFYLKADKIEQTMKYNWCQLQGYDYQEVKDFVAGLKSTSYSDFFKPLYIIKGETYTDLDWQHQWLIDKWKDLEFKARDSLYRKYPKKSDKKPSKHFNSLSFS